MSAGFAIDTNIAVYALSESDKAQPALMVLEAGPKISVQVLNEFVNVSLRKRKLPWPEIEESLIIIHSLSSGVRALDDDVHGLGCDLARRYKLSLYDSLIVAAALLDDCDALYTEDMQNGLVIDGQLTILNPFRDAP